MVWTLKGTAIVRIALILSGSNPSHPYWRRFERLLWSRDMRIHHGLKRQNGPMPCIFYPSLRMTPMRISARPCWAIMIAKISQICTSWLRSAKWYPWWVFQLWEGTQTRNRQACELQDTNAMFCFKTCGSSMDFDKQTKQGLPH